MAKKQARVGKADLARLQAKLRGVDAATPASSDAWMKAFREAKKTVEQKRKEREANRTKRGKREAGTA